MICFSFRAFRFASFPPGGENSARSLAAPLPAEPAALGSAGDPRGTAMGGGSDLLKLDDALASVDDFVAEKLK